MTSPDKRRILLALDVSPRSRSALEVAATLAAGFDVELAGLFVEDANLLRLSELPFAREVGRFSAKTRALAGAEMERALRREAEAVLRELSEAAARRSLRWSFKVARGQVRAELFALAHEFDMVVIGKRARSGVSSLDERASWRAAAARSAPPVMAVYDGSPNAARALELAARLARERGVELRVLVSAGSAEGFGDGSAQARRCLAGDAPGLRYSLRMFSGDSGELAALVRQAGAGVLVVADGATMRTGEAFATLLNDVDCPVVMLD